MASPKYRYVGRHPETLANGRPLAPGDTVPLGIAEQAHPHNQRLIDEGHLLALEDGGEGEDLQAKSREDLDKLAAQVGVEDPDALANKNAVIEAIQAKAAEGGNV